MRKTKRNSAVRMTSRKPMLKRIKGRAPAAGSSVDDPRALYMTQVGQPSADPILILEIRTQEPATNTQRPHSQEWLVRDQTNLQTVHHYLDDFIFIGKPYTNQDPLKI
eukprot:XP_011442973.1 PREDICTED: uncharacterized protein LOC105339218 [Crassostrea gigas]